MKIIANRMELLAAAQDALTVAPDKSPLDVLECTYLATEDGKLTVVANNLETSLERRIPVTIEEDGATIILAKLLVDVLQKLSGDSVTIEQKDGRRVEITGGDAFFGFPTLDAKSYPRPEIPYPGETVTVKGISAMAKRTVFAAAEGSDKPTMGCVHLIFDANGLRAVSSDSFRIAAAKGDTKSTGAVDMLIPAASLARLARLTGNKDEFQVGITGKTVVFMKEDFVFSARLVEGSYFDERQMFAMAKSRFAVLSDTDSLRKAMTSVYAVVGKQFRFSLSFQMHLLRMTCESEFGSSSVEVPVVPLSGNPNGVYWYNPEMLLECLRAQNGTLMLKVTQNNALLLESDELTCMQAAVREPKPIERAVPKPVEEKKEEKPKTDKPKGARKKKTAKEAKAA